MRFNSPVIRIIFQVQLVQDKQTSEVYVLKVLQQTGCLACFAVSIGLPVSGKALQKTYNPQVSKRRHKGKRASKNRGTMHVGISDISTRLVFVQISVDCLC